MKTTSVTLLKMQELKQALEKEIKLRDYHTNEWVTMTVIEAFRDDYAEGQYEVKKVIKETFGEQNQYVFWMMFSELCCPAGNEAADGMLRPLFDMNII